jgi:hypothetical protein
MNAIGEDYGNSVDDGSHDNTLVALKRVMKRQEI